MKSLYIISLLIILSLSLSAQQKDTIKEERFSIHAQTTIIYQYKLPFNAPYSGEHSLSTTNENQTSITSTLFAGARLWKGAGIFVNPELAGGSGLSQALGIAAETNGESFRIGDPAPAIYLARLYYRQLFSLTKERLYQSADANQLAQYIPQKYLALTLGKIGISDYFDDNKYSHDPRTQFMSWGLMSNGAWDYPANTRGYTPSFIIEYITPYREIRLGASLVPLVANGSDMNWNINKAGAYTIEYTHRYKLANRDGTFRILSFYNTANMGIYRKSISIDPTNPIIENTRTFGNHKYGFAVNMEQEISNDLGCFVKASWNDGNNETWMFTEIDHSLSAGISITGQRWKRANDNFGLADVVSGLSKPHREYLKAGGNGFMLGDGNLSYSVEELAEVYYAADIYKGHIFLTGAYQFLLNPGYNKDREGPVNVFSVRLHTNI